MQVFGHPQPLVVVSQGQPDPEFPTVTFPNPEEGRGTWAAAFEEGRARGARLIIGVCVTLSERASERASE